MIEGKGRCLCGRVTYKFDPEAVLWQGHCHCESCRRACSAPMTTFFGVRDSAWRWSGEPPAVFASSPGVHRFFCDRCGSQMAYRTEQSPGEIHGYSASLDAPEQAEPANHDHADEQLPWLHLADDLPRA
ncbi:GFA family protein [Psychromarinibacter sp. S121]|uniref:GFA family protein n=1 Tax=Psychromarinibacter sp. S121 TaxID=3415127 RepID=UPI003C7A75A7